MEHDDIVAVFNELGYTSTFATVAKALAGKPDSPTLASLYRDYPSREVLAEHWLSAVIPPASVTTLQEAFMAVVSKVLETLESRRDFSRSWLAAMKLTGPLHLPQLQLLHAKVKSFFATWLAAHETELSLPANIPLLQAKEDIADALTVLVFWLVVHWESDRTEEYEQTTELAHSAAYLVDALLIARSEFGNAGLLFHLHRLVDVPRQRFLLPILDTVLTSTRTSRLIDPVSLVEFIRTLKPSPVQRP